MTVLQGVGARRPAHGTVSDPNPLCVDLGQEDFVPAGFLE